ncbi:undecaprenyl-diphosphate phosphatase [Tropheryma whipplei]|uniref:undecaprenyl-diphosphate phosphatase n=1 Tax=Tropheryma whipplei TaxID=2039 RepID=UPI0002F75CF7|nr:undecaprenyl-diphosphate phosphatase [Tropheryma whipplei]
MLEAVLLGIVQGITEFLPISSTAHMYILAKLLNLHVPGRFFLSSVQLGTSFALILYFFKDVKGIISETSRSIYSFIQFGIRQKQEKRNEYTRLGLLLVTGTIPVVLLGFLLVRFVPDGFFSAARNLFTMGVALIVFGLLLGFADALFRRKKGNIFQITFIESVLIGAAQIFAIIPGVSRSGITITTARFLNFDRQLAVRFSFLLSLPVTFIGGMYGLVAGPDTDYYSLGYSLIGAIVSFVVGLLVVSALLRIISKTTFVLFVYYRVLFGLFLVIVSFF